MFKVMSLTSLYHCCYVVVDSGQSTRGLLRRRQEEVEFLVSYCEGVPPGSAASGKEPDSKEDPRYYWVGNDCRRVFITLLRFPRVQTCYDNITHYLPEVL